MYTYSFLGVLFVPIKGSVKMCIQLAVFLIHEFIVYTAQQFSIEPESVVQAEGLLAKFECLSPGAGHLWFVNGLVSTSLNFSSEIRISGGTSGLPSVLTIPASSQFNNSVIQCAAISLSGGVLSRNATLIVGEWHVRREYLELLCHFSQSVYLLRW